MTMRNSFHRRAQPFENLGIGRLWRQSCVLSFQRQYAFANRLGLSYKKDQLELGLMQRA